MNSRSYPEIAERMDAARRARHLSIRATAKMVGVPHTTVQGWLTGRHRPTPALRPQFTKLTQVLGVADELDEGWWETDDVLAIMRTEDPPYVGLRPFVEKDAPVFFGRERESWRLAQQVESVASPTGIVAVIGPSGCGKSSLLAAGLVAGQCGPDGLLSGRSAKITTVARLDEVASELPDLLVVDQFEEVLLDETLLRARLHQVAELSRRTTVVLGVRSDAFGGLSQLPELAEALSRPFLISPMTDDELRDVIVKPAQSRGVSVTHGLVEIILRDVKTETGVSMAALPLVSNALLLTWSAAVGKEMTVADYERGGGVTSAVESLSETVYSQLGPSQRQLAQATFISLVQLVGDRYVRKPMALENLGDEVLEVIQRFVDARILTVTQSELQISHEALLTNWPRLAGWVSESRDELRIREHLARAAQLWVDSGRSNDSLIPVERLPLFESFLDAPGREALLTPVDREFLAASKEHFASVLDAERKSAIRFRRRGRIGIALAVVSLSLALVAGVALWNAVLVQRQAQSRQISLQSRAFRSQDANLQAQTALASYQVAQTRESRSALIEASGTDVPTRWPGEPAAYLAVSPKQDMIARVDGLGNATLWNPDTIETNPGNTFVVDPDKRMLFTVALAEVGSRRLMAVGGFSGARSLWDVTAKPFLIRNLSSSSDTCYRAAFSPDGKSLALGLSDGSLEVWSLDDVDSPTLSGEAAIGSPVSSLAFHPTQAALFVGGVNDLVAVFSLRGNDLTRLKDVTWGSGEQIRVQDLAVSPDGKWLAAGLAAPRVIRWKLDGTDATPLDPLPDFEGWVNSVSFSPDSTQLIVGDSGMKVTILASESGDVQRILPSPSLVTSAELAGGRVVATGTDGFLRSWSAESRVLNTEGATLFQTSSDGTGGRWLATVPSRAQQVLLWNLKSGYERVEVPLPDEPVLLSVSVAISGDGNLMVAGTREGQVITWDLSDAGATNPRLWRAFGGGNMASVAVTSDGGLLAVSQYTERNTAIMQRQADGTYQNVATLETDTPQALGFSADASLLQVGIGANAVQLWDVSDPTSPVLAGQVETDTVPGASAFSPAAQRLAVGTDSGVVTLWDVSDPTHPRLEHSLGDSTTAMTFITFSPDGERLVSGSNDGTIFGWNLDGSNTAVVALDSRLGRANAGVFLRDGTEFVGVGGNGEVRRWDIEPDDAIKQLCGRRGFAMAEDEWQRFLPGVRPRELCR